MAVPTITATAYTTISNADATTGWVSFGGAMFGAGSDILKEGTNAIFIEAKSIARQGAGFDVGSGTELDLTVAGTKLFVWVNVISQKLVNTKANNGVTIVVSSESTGVFGINDGHWTIGGSDADWVGGGWKLFIIDPSRAFDITTGSPNKASIRLVGVTCDWVATVGKAPSLNIDIMRQGVNPNIEITGGTSGDPVGFQDILTKDDTTDDTQFGIITKDRNGNFELNGHMKIGDVAGATNTFVSDSNFVLEIQQEFVESGFNKIEITKDTGTTTLRLGTEVGTGNDSKGVGGGLIKAIATSDFVIDGSGAFDEFSIWGGVIDGASSILLKNTNVEWVSCTIANSGQIQLESGAEMREGFITDSTEASGIGAIKLIANPVDPEFRDMILINNIHAMENEINGPITWDLRGIKFSGNTADIRFNHASGLLTINVLEGGDTPSTSDGGAGGTISILNTVNLKVTVLEDDFTTANPGARVGIHRQSDNSELLNLVTDVNGEVAGTFNFSSDVPVFIRVRDELFDYVKAAGTITSTGLDITIVAGDDPVYA